MCPASPEESAAMTAGARPMGTFASCEKLGDGVLDTLPLPIFLVDGEGRCVACNRALVEQTGVAPDRLVGQDPYPLLAPEQAEGLREIDAGLLANGGDATTPGLFRTAEGGRLAVIYRSTVARDRQGRTHGVLVSVDDRPDVEALQAGLQAIKAEKQAILDGFPGILCLFDDRGRAIWVSDGVRELHTDPVGKSCKEIFCRSQHVCEGCMVLDCIHGGNGKPTIRQIELNTQSGEERIYELIGTPVRDRRGEVSSVMVIGRDVTDNFKLERQLRHTQKMEAIGTLAGGIAHDFNNVLTPIMGYSEIIRLKLLQDGVQDQATSDYLDGILRAARRAKSLVQQILMFSRSSEQKESLQYIHPIVKEVMKLMRLTLPSTIVIKEQINDQCGMVSVDPVQIHQILINLCTNSAHAMDGDHGSLTVTLDSAGQDQQGQEWLCLSVADTGCGIRQDMLDRIFEPYFTTKEKSRGTGMGLAMVHGIIERQGGRIEVDTEVGVGTTFRVLLPVSKKPTRLDQVINTAELVRGYGTILMVDDEAQVVEVTGELLTSLGYQVHGCTSPVEALALFAASPDRFDLLLTDLTMPEITGVELCQRLKEIRPGLPVVLFTGYSEQLSREAALAAGIAHYCTKPVSMRELSTVIFDTLEQR